MQSKNFYPEGAVVSALTATPLSDAIFDSSPDCVKILDVEGHLLAMNRNGQCIMEIDDFPAVCGGDWQSFWPLESHGMIRAALEAARAGETGHFGAFCPTAKGKPKWWDVLVTPIRDNGGQITHLLSVSRDVTALHQATEAAQRSHALLKKLTEQAPGVLYQFLLHPDGRFSMPYISSDAKHLYELSPAEIEKDASLVFGRIYEEDRETFIQSIKESAASLQPWHCEFRVLLPKQGLKWREGRSNPEKLEDGSILWHGHVIDITERKQLEQEHQQFHKQLEKQANYDTLTDLPNRRLFRDRLEQEIRHAARSGHHIALLFLDLDYFKEANDLLGHDAGDSLLQQVSKRIQECVRPEDTVARLGGDEFTVILSRIDQVNSAAQVARRIVDAIAVPFYVKSYQVSLTVSIGITIYPTDAQLPEDLIRNADQSMYRSKASGRNQLSFFERSMQVAALKRMELINELRQAVSSNQLIVHFQPVVDLTTNEVVKAEALVRWNHPTKGLVMPGEFIVLAEETGLINEIGDWVFIEAAAYSKRWTSMLGRSFSVSVNKSPIQLMQKDRKFDCIEHMRQNEMPRNSITFEITEGVLLNLTDTVSTRLKELRSAGFQLSIDDFGTGYSSMSYLKELDIDYLKIDQSFVRDMNCNATSRTIAKTIIVMAHELGLKVIAEGVELAEQRDWLKAHGCDYAQGYLFSKPIPTMEFEQLILSVSSDSLRNIA